MWLFKCRACSSILGTLGVCGELASHKRLFNPPPQFSRLGIQVSLGPIFLYFLYMYMCLSGLGSTFFLLFQLVCYTHVLTKCSQLWNGLRASSRSALASEHPGIVHASSLETPLSRVRMEIFCLSEKSLSSE